MLVGTRVNSSHFWISLPPKRSILHHSFTYLPIVLHHSSTYLLFIVWLREYLLFVSMCLTQVTHVLTVTLPQVLRITLLQNIFGECEYGHERWQGIDMKCCGRFWYSGSGIGILFFSLIFKLNILKLLVLSVALWSFSYWIPSLVSVHSLGCSTSASYGTNLWYHPITID